MSEPTEQLGGIDPIASDLLRDLAERLARHGLGEIEVRHGDLRLRVVRHPAAVAPPVTITGMPVEPHAGTGGRSQDGAGRTASVSGVSHGASAHGVTSPAVGYFVYGDGLGPGLSVAKGDPLGYIDVLGVRHDVRAPRSGVVRNLVTETGEAVEFGQVLIELEAAGA